MINKGHEVNNFLEVEVVRNGVRLRARLESLPAFQPTGAGDSTEHEHDTGSGCPKQHVCTPQTGFVCAETHRGLRDVQSQGTAGARSWCGGGSGVSSWS